MFGSNRRTRIPITKNDIKESIKKANRKLKDNNALLEKDISEKKKSLLLVEKEIDSSKNSINSLGKQIESLKDSTEQAKVDANRELVELSQLKKEKSKITSKNNKVKAELDSTNKEIKILKKDIEKMNSDLAISSTIREEILILKSDKKKDQKELEKKTKKAQGGRIGKQEGGLMDLGGQEKDYRDEGGFVALGGEERADDVPARLSKNEFVFTADAVRNAGGGDIDRGSEVMQNMMDNLEAGGEISEESQGLEGGEEIMSEEIIDESNPAQEMYDNYEQLQSRVA